MCGSGPWACSGSPWQLQAPLQPPPQPISQARDTGPGWLFLVSPASAGQSDPTSPSRRLWQFSAPPRGAPLCSLPEPCACRAQDDRLPRCCLCWRHGPEARDPETQRYRKGVRPGKKEVDRVRGLWRKTEKTGRQKTNRYKERKRHSERKKGRWVES